MTGAELYAEKVLSGDLIAGEKVIKACERFQRDLKNKDYIYNVEEAENIVIFFEKVLVHWEGKWRGTPIGLSLFQKFILQNLYGWETQDGRLRYSTSYIEVARKAAKTILAAGCALYDLIRGRDLSPQILIGANNEDQAKICTQCCGKLIETSPILSRMISTKGDSSHGKPINLYKREGRCYSIIYNDGIRDGFIKSMSKDPDTKDGFNPSKYIIDEYHAAKTDELKNVAESGQGARDNPTGMVVTTAGFNKSGVCYTKDRALSLSILNQSKVDESHFAFVAEMDDFTKWGDEREWIKANPLTYHPEYNNGENLSDTSLRNLRDRYNKAKNEGGSKEVDFKTKNLNVWTDSEVTWIPYETILKCEHNITEDELFGKDVYCGLDLSAGKDLNAFALFFPNVRPKVHCVKMMYWIPQDKIIQMQDNVDYKIWSDDGYMTVFDGNVVEYDLIVQEMLEALNSYTPISLGVDTKYFNSHVATHLKNSGYLDVIIPVGQGFNLTGATEQMEVWTSSETISFQENPVLRWNFSNVLMHVGISGHKYPSKGKSTNKIDGVSALVTAVHEYLRLGGEEQKADVRVIVI